jgi:HEAT repeat protein
MRTFLLGCVSLVIPIFLYAQTPVVDLVATVADDAAGAVARRAAALELGAATFADAAERQTALDALAQGVVARHVGLRVNAATALGRVGDPSSIGALAASLGDTQPIVRRASARSLGIIGTERAAHVLLRHINDGDVAVRAQVLHALGETGEPVAVGALGEVFLSHDAGKDARFQGVATRSLVQMGGFAVDTFMFGLGSHDRAKQLLAARALGELGDPRAAAALVNALDSIDAAVGAAAQSALSNLGEPAMPNLLAALDVENPATRVHALAAITDMGSPAVPTMVDLYTTSMTKVVQMEANLQVLEDAEAQAELEALVAVAQDDDTPPDPSTMTLSEIQREAKDRRKQLKILNAERKDVQELVVYRRAANTFDDWIEEGRRQLNDPAIGGPEILTEAITGTALLTTAPVEVVISPKAQAAAAALSSIQGLKDGITEHRRRAHDAVVALGQIGDDVAVTTLADVVTNGAVVEATLAASALGRSDNPNAIAPLTAALADATAASSVRANAARGLGSLGAAQAQATLEQLAATDPAPNVRRAARQALDMLAPSVSLAP